MTRLTILPSNCSAEVPAGTRLLDAGAKAGVEMEAGCLDCCCGTCVVEVISGMSGLDTAGAQELEVLDQWNRDPEKYRLACTARLIAGKVVIRQMH